MDITGNPFKVFPHKHKWVLNGFQTRAGTQKPKFICAVCGKERK